MDDTTQKILISLVSVFVGVVLGQIINVVKIWWSNRKLKLALLIELEDLKRKIGLLETGYARNLQLMVHGGIDPSSPVKLSNRIFTKYYADIFFKLNRGQRESYDIIHGLIDSINAGIDQERDILIEYFNEKDIKTYDKWKDVIQAQFTNVLTLTWHINFHLANKSNPDLGDVYSREHQAFLIAKENIFKRMYEILEKAKKLNPKEFEKIYREEDFKHLQDDEIKIKR